MHGPDAPSPWVQRFAPLVARGASVLDLACGGGRHARLFAQRGCVVDAVDRDPACGEALAGEPNVRFLAADLEGGPWPYAERRFDAIVVANYLHRPLFPRLAASLADGGVLIYETFAVGNERYGRPSNPDFLLRPRELLDVFGAQLHVLAFEDGVVGAPRPARIQRLCAVRASPAAHERLRLDASR
ncbi:MAG: class I SAM-dependent methyltransferase [Pseudomonadota bacterium]